jgi:hypothetical protein
MRMSGVDRSMHLRAKNPDVARQLIGTFLAGGVLSLAIAPFKPHIVASVWHRNAHVALGVRNREPSNANPLCMAVPNGRYIYPN